MASTALLAPADLDLATAECDDASCGRATSHASLCECSCRGEGHGHIHRAGIAAAAKKVQARTVNGFTRSMLSAMDDTDAAF